jgi:hypothetical protein
MVWRATLEVVVVSGGPPTRAKLIRQDLCFLVSILLLFAMIGAALTGLAGDEDEFFGIGDDLHSFAGWSMIVLATAHVLLYAGHMMRYVKRRLRRLVGVGGVVRTGADRSPRAE